MVHKLNTVAPGAARLAAIERQLMTVASRICRVAQIMPNNMMQRCDTASRLRSVLLRSSFSGDRCSPARSAMLRDNEVHFLCAGISAISRFNPSLPHNRPAGQEAIADAAPTRVPLDDQRRGESPRGVPEEPLADCCERYSQDGMLRGLLGPWHAQQCAARKEEA